MKSKFYGSNITLILGILGFMGGVARVSNGDTSGDPFTGVLMILGSLSYKSLKKRKIGLVENSLARKLFESLALLAIVAIVVLQRDLHTHLVRDPVPNVIIPLWIFAAYGAVFFKTQKVA
jgi:hypothetical protein